MSRKWHPPFTKQATVAAMPSLTPIHIWIWILPAKFAILQICSVRQWLWPWKHAKAKCTTKVFNSQWKYEKLAVVVCVPQTPQYLVMSPSCFAENGKRNVQRFETQVLSYWLLSKPELSASSSNLVNISVCLTDFYFLFRCLSTQKDFSPVG